MEIQVMKQQYLFTLSVTPISLFPFLSFHFSLPFPLPLHIVFSTLSQSEAKDKQVNVMQFVL